MRFGPRSAGEIAALIKDCLVQGDGSLVIDNVTTISECTERSLGWINPSRVDKAQLIASTQAGCVIMRLDEQFIPRAHQVFLKCPNPQLALVKVLKAVLPPAGPPEIHPTAVISPLAVIHETVAIGAKAVLEDCEIGEGTVIGSGVFIGRGTKIGRFVGIAPGVVIGADGFGYVDEVDGTRVNMPHVGHVEIEDHVDIGANTCIDRGTLGRTLIKEGAKIDNLVHVAHNVIVGKDAMVIANTMIGGGTVIGDRAWIAPSATLRDAIRIGRDSLVGLGALVTKSVPDGEIWAGHPAKLIRPRSTS